VYERWNVVRPAIENPPRLLRREAEGQLTQKLQKLMLFFFHAHPNGQTSKTELVKMICHPLTRGTSLSVAWIN
jgi:hypothetical protein